MGGGGGGGDEGEKSVGFEIAERIYTDWIERFLLKLFCSSQVTKSSAGLMRELVYSSRIKGTGKWIFQILIYVGRPGKQTLVRKNNFNNWNPTHIVLTWPLVFLNYDYVIGLWTWKNWLKTDQSGKVAQPHQTAVLSEQKVYKKVEEKRLMHKSRSLKQHLIDLRWHHVHQLWQTLSQT